MIGSSSKKPKQKNKKKIKERKKETTTTTTTNYNTKQANNDIQKQPAKQTTMGPMICLCSAMLADLFR